MAELRASNDCPFDVAYVARERVTYCRHGAGGNGPGIGLRGAVRFVITRVELDVDTHIIPALPCRLSVRLISYEPRTLALGWQCCLHIPVTA
jgi:hypothetical protein